MNHALTISFSDRSFLELEISANNNLARMKANDKNAQE